LVLEPRSLEHLFVLAYIVIYVFRGNLFQAHSLEQSYHQTQQFNPLNAELNPICHLLALLGGATIVVFNRLRVKRGKYNRKSKYKINLFNFYTLYM